MNLGGANHAGRGGNPPLCAGHDPRHAARAAILIVAIATAAALLAPGGWDGHAAHDTGPAWPFGAAHAQQADTTSFKTTWKTDSASEEITLPVRGSGITIYWGDGTNSTGVSGDANHTYAAAGNHTISVSGGLTGIFLNGTADAPRLVSIDQWGNASWTTMDSAFEGAENMVYNATDAPDLSAVTNMTSMFEYASSFNGNISTWNVSQVTDMNGMFAGATSFNQDIFSWDVSKVTNMAGMFSFSYFNGNISSWDVSSVRNMAGMFYYSSFNGNISSWDVSSVTDMQSMFGAADFNGTSPPGTSRRSPTCSECFTMPPPSTATSPPGTSPRSPNMRPMSVTEETSQVRDMGYMFSGASFNGNISSWDVSSVRDMGYMFSGASFNGNISTWDVSSVTDMGRMFFGASSFNGNISTWDVSSVTDMGRMFFGASSFNDNISAWNVSSVTRHGSHVLRCLLLQRQHLRLERLLGSRTWVGMFSGASSFNGNISSWDVSSATDMTNMFNGASAFSQNLGSWYIALDDTTISVGVETLEIRAQNAYLKRQNPVYAINDTSFVFNDNGLIAVNFTSPPVPGYPSGEHHCDWRLTLRHGKLNSGGDHRGHRRLLQTLRHDLEDQPGQ